MSLTRAEWEEMWDSVKRIEINAKNTKITSFLLRQRVIEEVRRIKEQIQSVIGQME